MPDEYKLVNASQLERSLAYEADRLRAKMGGNSTIPFDFENEKAFGDAVDSIQTGGITPSGALSITENGTYDVTEKESAVVNVPSGGITPIGTKQITISENGTTTEDVTNYASASITVNVPSSSSADDYIDRYFSTNDFVVSMSDVTGLKLGANFAARSIRLMRAVNTGSEGIKNLIYNNSKVQYIVAPVLGRVPLQMCNSCTGLLGADIWATSMGTRVFSGNSKFGILVLRNSDTVCALESINAFENSKFASGKAGGTLYVPSALISSYQSATNWSTILGYSTNNILPI